MACNTCSHTMPALFASDSVTVWWCPHCGTAKIRRGARGPGDGEVVVPRQVAELERTADKLSDCWLFLDAVAHSECLLAPRQGAAALLRKQEAPGWKNTGE